jgi:hypothetical protein
MRLMVWREDSKERKASSSNNEMTKLLLDGELHTDDVVLSLSPSHSQLFFLPIVPFDVSFQTFALRPFHHPLFFL